MKPQALILVPFLATGAGAGGNDDLSKLYAGLEDEQSACFAATAEPDGLQTTIADLVFALTKSVESPNGTSAGEGFTFELGLGLSGQPDGYVIYGCCTQEGYCGTGETCGDQPIFAAPIADGLRIDLSAYPRNGPTTVTVPVDQRLTLGPEDRVFELAAVSCPAP
ncbi:hypothetical protein AADZ90_014145 [Aestuariibius sp. 2305UL40-4]|uniref:hypothetical protein n=1 Tax=Aestuariibius violaceus TaxID=3234132 RepID=UPI00345F0450